MTDVARDEGSWLDDAFADEKGGENGRRASGQRQKASAYDWIDDAFDDSKEDPLARKGMTGCSSLATLLAVLAILLLLAVVAFFALNGFALLQSAASL